MNPAVLDRLTTLSPNAIKRLLSQEGSAEPPIRAELFGIQRFEEHGCSLAQAQIVETDAQSLRHSPFFPRVEGNLAALRAAYDYVALTSHSGHYATPAAEWLLDNFPLIEAQLQQIREGVPRRFYARLPKLAALPLRGLPRVYGIAWAYVAHTDSVLNPEVFTAFLNAYQTCSELRLSELWALPTTLRVVLLENLRRMADDIARSKLAREVAHAVWDSGQALDEADLDTVNDLMRQRGVQRSYQTQLWQRLPTEISGDSSAVVRWIEKNCPDGHALMLESQSAQVASNLTVGNIITTLRVIGQIDWVELIEPVSRSLQVLQQLPGFAGESESTRQQITRAMEQLARDSFKTEHAVAQAVVEAALSVPGSLEADAAERTAGFWLMGDGRARLEADLDMPVQRARQRLNWRRWRLSLYIGCITLATAVMVLLATYQADWHRWQTLVALLLLASPAFEAASAFVHRLIAESLKVQPLPRLGFASGIPPEHRVLVVIPTLLTSTQANEELLNQLEFHWLANRENQAQYGLLTDWVDASETTLPGDAALLQDALERLETLNARYPAVAGSAPRFLLIHRPRSWCETQQQWLGWERKRGKLEQLMRLLATGSMEGFLPLTAPLRLADGIRYVVTLDSDTGLPPGALRELVAIAAHPLNAPRVDARLRRVVSGYGILQPRVVMPLPGRSEDTAYHRLFAGQGGIDPYSSGVSDVYQDLFGTGSFSGKGLLHVKALHAVLDHRLPDEAVLSHDLLEGSIARCGFVSDVMLVEHAPHHAGVAASRQHRWTRGDWQLLPLLWHARRYGIDALSVWKMLDNLRRSLVFPTSFALLAWVIFTDALPLGTVFLAVIAALLAGPLLGALAGLVPTHAGIAWRHFFKRGGIELRLTLGSAAWQFSQIPAQSVMLLDAVLRSVWRMCVSHRRLMEWTTAAQAQSASRKEFFVFVHQHAAASLLCAGLAMAAPWAAHPWVGIVLFLFWGASPIASWWASQPRPASTEHALSAGDKRYLMVLARDTWRFFERCVGPEDNHLPPDNLQMVPDPTVAHRTSPTNIGLYLLAVCCAREFGWITTHEVILRLQASLDSIDKLAKHNGHLFNWYDTQTLRVLMPAYVSSVDSGNLAGMLLAVGQACQQFAQQDKQQGTDSGQVQAQAQSHAALHSLASRCASLYEAMNFKGLYDPKRRLFHIGLRVDEQALDSSYYDLLASESRLASFLAIAKGDVPKRHWSALGRPFLSVRGTPGLASWSGSMFEYLMPSLLMHEPDEGLLQTMARSAIAAQREFGQQQFLPWGVSESAYFAQDHSLAYQYSPFGVPRLAMRRTPLTDRVVAPYATLLATLFEPAASAENLRRLEALGARGELGMFEALDFTASHQPEREAFSIVQTFMAHHQGMSLVALCNVLCLDAPRRWFCAEPQVAAHQSLLHERTPRQITETASPRQPPATNTPSSAPVFHSRDVNPVQIGWKPTHLLSNGRYNVALRASGAGVSRWQGRNISRWRDDLLRDSHGCFFYLNLGNNEGTGSLTAAPAPLPGWRYQARFMADRVQFDAHGKGLSTGISVVVSPEDDTELRTVQLHNTGRTERIVELVSCFEAVLADPRADEAHPAFSNLFVQTRWEPKWRALLLKRMPRLHGDPQMAVAHFLAEADAELLSVDCIADRKVFAGRHQPPHQPALGDQPMDADGNPINGLDPVASLRLTLRLAPGAVARLTFATAAAQTEDELIERIDKYLQPMHIVRATQMAATLAQVRLRDLTLTPEEHLAVQDLTTALMYSTPRINAVAGPLDQRQLWRFGISGDKPIVLVRIQASSGLPLVNALLRAQPWWTFGGLAVDLVVLNSEPNSYLMVLQRDILAMRDRLTQRVQDSFAKGSERLSSFHLLREPETSTAEKTALAGMARVVLTADGRALETQVAALRTGVWPAEQADLSGGTLLSNPSEIDPVNGLPALASVPQGIGQFDPANGEFWFDLQGGQSLPRPWVNVIANPDFGFQVSETGSGMTWAGNSRMHQLTPWSNDPVGDPAFEHWLLQDMDSGQVFPLAPSVIAGSDSRWRVRHGQGYSVFQGKQDGLQVETTFFADMQAAVKVVQVKVRLDGGLRRRLRAIAMVEWQMGDTRSRRRTLQTWKSPEQAAVMARQQETRDGYGGSTAFLVMAGAFGNVQWTCDRGEFFDALGRLLLPTHLAGQSGTGYDPCACLASEFSLAGQEERVISFILGHAVDGPEAERMAGGWTPQACIDALAGVKAAWSGLLGKVQVKTPDARFDALINHWLLYQTVVCRLWSKAGFYQAGGASGFRDQLQDSMALALADPARLRAQIVLSASRQFPEGDVQHWWHAPGGEGVRTHFSDDLLWLPYACSHYLQATGDASLLDESVAFIDGAPIPDGAEDAYYAPQTSEQSASVYEHCARTIDRSLAVGAHGLPLMGTGDWNDGMNRVGHEGRGQSVWLGWFLCSVVEGFAPVAQKRGDDARAQRWLEARTGWITALHDAGWDGAWFRRAFFDNGAPLGANANDECRIDLIAQAWAVLSGASTPAFTRSAMLALNNQLIDEKAGLLRLLDPPFRDSANNPGYIQAYPPGVRENGGQYSHAGVWALMAQALSGDAEGAWRSFEDLSPAHRSAHPERGAAYGLEPYVVAGDVYSAEPYVGRGGWSWYTGSAAWLYRAGLETLLGLAVQPGRLSLSPRLPSHWPEVELRLQLQGRDITVHWLREPAGVAPLVADRQLAWGEWTRLDTLPAKSVLLVRGSVAPALPDCYQ
ncbi:MULTISPECIES: GH36-type glycosyl hydrolase domain-containing protein [unclassified Polaromonas]|uniref:GH36-type glycosyl hydrolase domain-containing protein n=1 Tax=unclassified Polaromonas TaxID=2638319 RepID=UPI0018CA3A80|nr:cyclic beta-1,2-glucan synthetase [Polaromonas sp. CG_9.7]MBG6112503.1 cyclic beta-1,2-glucan synthetase [Polaromonas sp. CG_9.2]